MKYEMNFTERAVPGLTANFLMQEAISRYEFARKFINKQSIICDMACGTGYGSHLLSKKANLVIGIDISDEALNFASTMYGNSKTSFLKQSVEATIFQNNTFSEIIAFEMIEHLSKPAAFLREAKRILKPKGVLILSTPNKIVQSPTGEPMSPYHTKEYAPKELEKLLKMQFTNVQIYGQKRSVKVDKAYSDFMNSQKVRQLLVDLDIFKFRKFLTEGRKEIIWQRLGAPFGRASQEYVSTKEYEFSKTKIEECDYIIAICKK